VAARRPEVVGIGEVGLDYYWPQKEWMPDGTVHPLETQDQRSAAGVEDHPQLVGCLHAQADVFNRWMDLADELNLPLVVHERDSRTDTARLLGESRLDPGRVAFHCFTGTAEEAVSAAQLGYWISVPSSAVWREPFRSIATAAPLERMLSETDAPYHSPMAQLWKKLYHGSRQWAQDEGLAGARAEKSVQTRRRAQFGAALERDYPGLTFDVQNPETGMKRVPILEHMANSRRRNENESSFVRAVPRTVAEQRDLDYSGVCETLAANARRFYGL
jgi:Tat protein secretion system quality control protein TatD with DNase activity